MAHAWRGYVRYAWGNDELQPVSQVGKDSFGGLGATIVDALDTLWLMEMQAEYQAARDWVANKLRFDVYVELAVIFFVVFCRSLIRYHAVHDACVVETHLPSRPATMMPRCLKPRSEWLAACSLRTSSLATKCTCIARQSWWTASCRRLRPRQGCHTTSST